MREGKNIRYFQEKVSTIQELKAQYYKLAKKHHPDVGGSEDIFKEISNEYEYLFDLLKAGIDFEHIYQNYKDTDFTQTNYTYQKEENKDFQEIISKIIHIPDVDVEICGYYKWVSGNTRPYRKEFRNAGFNWHSKKSMWYWKPEGIFSKSRKNTPMGDIRSKYGSIKVQTKSHTKIS